MSHLIIPSASALCFQEGSIRSFGLPHLSQLLKHLRAQSRWGTDEYSLSTPFEQALAQVWGWRGCDGLYPWAAHHAQQDGIDVSDLAWGALTPVHCQVGADHITVSDPAAHPLSESQARVLFAAIAPLFESEGWRMVWGSPSRWYVTHESLAEQACASLERVIGRSMAHWIAPLRSAKIFRRLQNEAQMVLHEHQATSSINSLWLSGCGRWQAVSPSAQPVNIEPRLCEPALQQDYAAWRQAWLAIDASTVRLALEALLTQGQPITLTLTGERLAQSWHGASPSRGRNLLKRWQAGVAMAPLLSGL